MSWTLDPRYVPANVKWAKKAPTHLGDTIAALQGRPRDVSTIKARPTTLSERLASAIVPDGRKWTDLRNKVSGAVDALTPLGAEQPLRDARSAYQSGNKWGAAGLGALAMLGAIPGVGTEAKAGTKAAKGIFGKRALLGEPKDIGLGQKFYQTPEGAYITVMENAKYAPRPNSITDFVVPEELRGQGIGSAMLDEVLRKYDPATISAAASSEPSVRAFYKRGFRPTHLPQGSLEDALNVMREDSSVTLAMPKPQGIIAYHGSPHSFDKFSLDKIGTGEGAQAYGHGLYFAENEVVANSYKHAVSGRHAEHTFDGNPVKTSADWWQLENKLNDGGDWRQAQLLKEYAGSIEPDTALRFQNLRSWHRDSPKMLEAIDQLEKRVSTNVPKGSMYQVRINANPEDFLDWDKPLSGPDQAEALAAKFDSVDPVMRKTLEDWTYENSRRNLPMPDGQDIVAKFGGVTGANSAALSQNLKSAGIPGIKYLDQGSRGAGDGSRNYVVFDDALIEILKKYGIAVPAMGLGIAGMSRQPEGGM